MEYFVDEQSIVRKIWGKSDTILFIFAGASAEFALNKAVDWLYFTGHLPANPLLRLFSTVSYARTIVFSEKQAAMRAIDSIVAIHAGVEGRRGAKIPDWAYRDVLFMLIDYSIRSFEILERKLTAAEKQEAFDVFYRVGHRMGIKGLPGSFKEWKGMRQEHLQQNMQYSYYSADLFRQYRKNLGAMRYNLLLGVQRLIIPKRVRKLLNLGKSFVVTRLMPLYKLSRLIRLDRILMSLILPPEYKKEIMALNR